MTTKDDGGPAFPIADAVNVNGDVQPGCNGISTRDYFAAVVELPDVIPDDVSKAAAIIGLTLDEYLADVPRSYLRCVAKVRFMMADAMLAERAQ